jgi:hypothetical protein
MSGSLVELALYASAQIRLMHWCTTNYIAHKGLGDLYENLDELFDRLIESYLGDARSLSRANVKFNLTFPTNNNVIAILDDVIYDFNKKRKTLEETSLQNIIDEIVGAISQAKYLIQLK